MITAIIFILILGVLIFVHELGHFLTARRNGIKADEFGFGFPPRLGGFFKDEKTDKWKFILGNKDIQSKNTIYSLNWIPLGGFVKIKGENGDGKNELDSFASKSAWKRIKVLAAGVMMNFLLAWVLLSLVLWIGAPESIDTNGQAPANAKIQISEVLPDSPASSMGLKVGDEILRNQKFDSGSVAFNSVADVQDYINSKKGQTIKLQVKRGEENLTLSGTPRVDAPQGQGPLGISLSQTVIDIYSWYAAIWNGLVATFNLIIAMIVALFGIIKGLLVGLGVSSEIAGPIGIAVLTKQVATLGIVYVIQFAAILSINLGIINAFPFPALDGGRILFILIEKIKGSPVSQRTEQAFHTVGFVLLIILMILITFRDVTKFIK
jgi:regulator of sigma E protease